MLSNKRFTYYQPEAYYDDGTNINYGALPEELFSFQAFRSKEECRAWLVDNDYNPDDFIIHEYCNDEIEDVTIIDEYGDIIPKIETLTDDEIAELLADEVLITAGSIDNLAATRQSDETEEQFKERVHDEAVDEVNAAIVSIEKSGDYDFSNYGGSPDIEWYDRAKDDAVTIVMRWVLGKVI